jgi:hypothetical protein
MPPRSRASTSLWNSTTVGSPGTDIVEVALLKSEHTGRKLLVAEAAHPSLMLEAQQHLQTDAKQRDSANSAKEPDEYLHDS